MEEETITKTLIFEDNNTHQSFIVQHDLINSHNNIQSIIMQHCPSQCKLSIYDPQHNLFRFMETLEQQKGCIPRQYLEPAFILIRYQRTQCLSVGSPSTNEQSYKGSKEVRKKERTICEVLELVKRWRDLHIYGPYRMRRRLNLQDAAKVVGISKKSLDDYYCQLRLGEHYQFDFQQHLNYKIGFLRDYVKYYHPRKNRGEDQKYTRHPKNLKVLNHYDYATKTIRKQSQAPKEMQNIIKEDDEVRQEREFKENEVQDNQKMEVWQVEPNGLMNVEESPISLSAFDNHHIQQSFFSVFKGPFELIKDPQFFPDRDRSNVMLDFEKDNFRWVE